MLASGRLRVSIVHSDNSFREGLRWLLQGIPELDRIEAHESLGRLLEGRSLQAPHVVVVEAGRDLHAFSKALKSVQAQFPCARFLVHLEQIEPRQAAVLLENGVAGFVLRSDSQGFLFDAVRSVAEGNLPISPKLTRSLMSVWSQTSWAPAESSTSVLSKRERELIDGLARGLRYQDLAQEMGISIETIRTHVRRAYSKLKVNSRGAAVAKFVRECSLGMPLQEQSA